MSLTGLDRVPQPDKGPLGALYVTRGEGDNGLLACPRGLNENGIRLLPVRSEALSLPLT